MSSQSPFAVSGLATALASAGHPGEARALREPFFLAVARHYPDYRWFREQPEVAAILREMDAPGV